MSEHNNNRAEVDTTAREELVNKIVAEINRRTRIPFHPDFSSSKDALVLMPKGIALFKAAEVGFVSEPPTDDEMKRFNEFWEEMEGYVIPYSLELYAHKMAQKYRAETQKATAQTD